MKGQPLAYNKDNQEDKEPLFDTMDTVTDTLRIFADMIGAVTVRHEMMRQAALQGYATATDLADYLVKKGLPFRDAHEAVARAVRYCVEKGCDLSELTLEQMRTFSEQLARLTADNARQAGAARQEQAEAIKRFGDTLQQSLTALTESNAKRMGEIRTVLEEKIRDLQTDNAKKLEEMRQTTITEGALYYGQTRRRETVLFDRQLRELTEKTIADVHTLFSQTGRPPPVNDKRCRDCSLKNDCMPELAGDPSQHYLQTLLEAT